MLRIVILKKIAETKIKRSPLWTVCVVFFNGVSLASFAILDGLSTSWPPVQKQTYLRQAFVARTKDPSPALNLIFASGSLYYVMCPRH